eukprot:jgi/Psemu1/57556/gm1.57556_g
MVPPQEAYDWSNVYGIVFTFQSDNKPQEVLSLNGSYAETVPLRAPKISPLFTSDAHNEGLRILGPAPVTALREAFCHSVNLDMANINEIAKGHIARLINSCPKLSNNQKQPADTKQLPLLNSILTNENNWKTNDPANYFHSIYTDNNGIPTDTNTDAVVTPPHSSGPSAPPITDILTAPIKPVGSKAHTAIQAPSSCVTSSSATTDLPTIKLIDSDVVTTPSNSTTSVHPVTANFGPLQPVGPIADTPSVNAPCYIWTWTYSPHSESVSFRQVRSGSISFQRAISSSPPVQRQEKSSIVTSPSLSPSAQTRFGHHSAPPCEPANFRWTFNPQSETVTFHRLPKPAPVPLKPPSRFPLSATTADNPVFSCPIHSKHSKYSSCLKPNPRPVLLRLSKRHRDALSIQMNHLYANILSTSWFYDPVD